MTPGYTALLRVLAEQRVAVRFQSVRTVQGQWSSAESVATEGCQCATTWGVLYVEHRLRLNGQLVQVDEELVSGSAATATPETPARADTRNQRSQHTYRWQNLVMNTDTADRRILAVLDGLLAMQDGT
jgi:hypothetical protein